MRELRDKGRVDYGYLGVTTLLLYPQLAERLDLRVRRRRAGGGGRGRQPGRQGRPRAGSRKISFQGQEDVPADGDVIVAVDGARLTRRDDLTDVISAMPAGEEVELEVLRDGERRTVKVELGRRPSAPPEP